MYKKAERLASALYLIAPALHDSVSLRVKVEALAVALTEAACLPPGTLAGALSRELLTLSSLLSMARAGGFISAMNADLIASEARSLLAEVALYEEPRLTLAEPASLAVLARQAPRMTLSRPVSHMNAAAPSAPSTRESKGQSPGRQQSILSFIKDKGHASIKDLSAIVRGVSEKTIQRELQVLIETGQVVKRGERRWSTYTPA